MPLLVVAHRGASGTCPENTLAAFRRAADLGAHMIELDVQLTRDRRVIVLHDATLERTTSGTGPASDRTLAEIEAFDAGSWFGRSFAGERVPTLDAVLAEVALPVNVELKAGGDGELARRVLAVVEAAGAMPRVVFSCFEPAPLEEVRERSRRAGLAVLWDRGAISGALRLAERVGATALHLRKDLVTSAAVTEARRAGLEVRAWTVNETAEMPLLSNAGVTGIFSDFPERFLHKRWCGPSVVK